MYLKYFNVTVQNVCLISSISRDVYFLNLVIYVKYIVTYFKSKSKCKFGPRFRPQRGECAYALQLAARCSSTAQAAGPISTRIMFLYPGRSVLSFPRKGLPVRPCFERVRITVGGLRSFHCAGYACPRHDWQNLLHRERGLFLKFVGRVLVHLYTERGVSHFAGRICVGCYGG